MAYDSRGQPLIYRVFDRTHRPGPPPRDWKAWVVDADPNWAKDSVMPVVYQFSNNRGFAINEQPGQAYGWTGTGT